MKKKYFEAEGWGALSTAFSKSRKSLKNIDIYICNIVGPNRMEKESPAYDNLRHGHQLPSSWRWKG